MQANLEYINRDALAYLLGLVEGGPREPKALVIDLRRHDERSMYGKIPGKCHSDSGVYSGVLQCLRWSLQGTIFRRG